MPLASPVGLDDHAKKPCTGECRAFSGAPLRGAVMRRDAHHTTGIPINAYRELTAL
jgi:hypothetical protein